MTLEIMLAAIQHTGSPFDREAARKPCASTRLAAYWTERRLRRRRRSVGRPHMEAAKVLLDPA